MPDHESDNFDDTSTSADAGSDKPTACGRTSDEAETATSGGAPLPPPSLKRLGDFELLRELGRGGMGVVYEARQVSLKRRVALKVLPPALGMSPQAKQRFEREAQAAAKLHHTNIVPVHAIGEHDGHHYYAMDLIEGESLDRVLRDVTDQGSNPLLDRTVTQAASALPQRQQPPANPSPATTSQGGGVTSSLGDTSAGSRPWFDAVAKLIAEVADGLDYAHGRGVIHRDIKPANLMLSSEGRLCIADFGLARIVQEPGMTVSGSFLGTPAYMSPEQIAAGRMKLDHRTDVYSLGAVLYEMLTHQRPFPGDSREEVIGAIMTKDPRAPRKFNGKIPQDLETICLKALEKDPDRRYATAGAFAQDLRQYLQHGLIAAKRAGLLRRTGKSIRRHPVAAMAVLAAVLVVGVGAVAWQQMSGRRSSDVERMVSDARLRLTRGEYREARAACDEILVVDPENLHALLIRARLDIHHWDWWGAVAQARKVLSADPDNWEAHLLIAAAAKKGGLYSVPAAEHLAAVEGLVPETVDALFLRGWVASFEDYRVALEWLNRALEQDPGHALALEMRSDTYIALKDMPAALADADRLTAARPRSSVGPAQAGAVYSSFQQEQHALEAYNQAIELDPEDPKTYVLRSHVHGDSGYDQRVSDLARAIELDPEQANSRTARGDAHILVKEYDLALADYRLAKELNPDYLWAYWGIFRAHWAAGRPDEARAALRELEERAQSWVDKVGLCEYHQGLARRYSTLGDHDRAIAEAKRAVELRPGDVQAHSRLIIVRRIAQGQASIAGDCDRMAALELDEPGELNERAYNMRALCNRNDQALEDSAKAIELAPNWAEPHCGRGLALVGLKRYDEALDAFSQALDLEPKNVDAIFNRARLLFEMGRMDEMRAAAARAVEVAPGESASYVLTALSKLFPDSRCEQARGDLARALDLGTDNPETARYLAEVHGWVLHGLCPTQYDGDLALRLARKAVEENPEDAKRQSTLGVVLYRHARLSEARDALARAVELATPKPDASTLFALAMVEQLGDRPAEARRRYEEAVERTHALALQRSPVNRLLQAEAAEVLGLP